MARIAFLIPDMGGGGAERVGLSLIEGFLGRGHDVDLLLTRREGALLPLVPPQVRIIELGGGRLRSALFPLIRYLRRIRPDALQVSMWPLTIIAIIAARLARTGVRVVTSDHTTYSRHYAGQSRRLKALAMTVRRYYPLAAQRIAVSEGAMRDLAALSGLSPDSFSVIFNPIPVPPADPEADRRALAEWNGARHRILAVGSLKPEKNYPLLLEAVSRLDAGLDWRLIILGEGVERGKLEQALDGLGIRDRVSLPGFRLDPAPCYRTASQFVLTSDLEGLPTVLIEALQHGLPVTSTDCEHGPAEILDGGKFGRLVPRGDATAVAEAIARNASAPVPADRLRDRARAFAADIAVDRYLAALLAGTPPRRAK